MWQRIQTIFLFLSAIFAFMAGFVTMKTNNIFIINGFENISVPLSIVFLASIFVILIAIITIFFYKRRKAQIKLCNINIILLILILAIIVFTHIRKMDLYFSVQEIITLTLAIISLILIIFAKKFIQKDEKKVRAWERIR